MYLTFTSAMYAASASALDSAPRSDHAFHFSLPTKSIMPGFGAVFGPTVACLNNAYSFRRLPVSTELAVFTRADAARNSADSHTDEDRLKHADCVLHKDVIDGDGKKVLRPHIAADRRDVNIRNCFWGVDFAEPETFGMSGGVRGHPLCTA